MNTLKFSNRPAHRVASILAVSALALGLSACGKTEEPNVVQAPAPVERTDQTAAGARNDTSTTMQNAETRMDQAVTNAGAAVSSATSATLNNIDDATITAKVNASLAQDPDLSAVKINVDTVNGTEGPSRTVSAQRLQYVAASTANAHDAQQGVPHFAHTL